MIKKKWRVLLVILVSLGVSFGLTKFIIKPEYSSTARLYILNQVELGEDLTAQDIQLSTLLVNDYKEITVSDSVLNEVISKEKLNISPAQLRRSVKVESPKETRIINIQVRNNESEKASKIANKIMEVAKAKISSVTKV